MDTFRKECSANEIRLHKIASELECAPRILETDNTTYMVMENIPSMNLADYYGETIRRLPHWIRNQIIDILHKLYTVHGIQYVDVTPYNFIEHNGKIWIVDFGHASDNKQPLHPHIAHMFHTRKLRWNKEFK